MSSPTEWKVPASVQPHAADYSFDLEQVLASVVGLHAIVPPDAFTAETLGVERAGNGVVIADGLIVTIGYLITEAESVWIHLGDGRVAQGHALGFDQESGFGLVQALGALDVAPLPIGSSAAADIGDKVIVAGVGGRARSVAAKIAARQEFAGYWEYLLEDAIFTLPSHPNWGGAGLISPRGELIGIGSLQLERSRGGRNEHLNMIVPIDLLKPVIDDIRRIGRADRPARPWLGLFTTEIEDKIIAVGVAEKGPAGLGGLKSGDEISALAGRPVASLADFYRRLWSLGAAGVEAPLTLVREGRRFDVTLISADRHAMLRRPRLH